MTSATAAQAVLVSQTIPDDTPVFGGHRNLIAGVEIPLCRTEPLAARRLPATADQPGEEYLAGVVPHRSALESADPGSRLRDAQLHPQDPSGRGAVFPGRDLGHELGEGDVRQDAAHRQMGGRAADTARLGRLGGGRLAGLPGPSRPHLRDIDAGQRCPNDPLPQDVRSDPVRRGPAGRSLAGQDRRGRRPAHEQGRAVHPGNFPCDLVAADEGGLVLHRPVGTADPRTPGPTGRGHRGHDARPTARRTWTPKSPPGCRTPPVWCPSTPGTSAAIAQAASCGRRWACGSPTASAATSSWAAETPNAIRCARAWCSGWWMPAECVPSRPRRAGQPSVISLGMSGPATDGPRNWTHKSVPGWPLPVSALLTDPSAKAATDVRAL